jgi:mono/diheme cytochrome c family protein
LISRILGALVAPFFILTACTPQSAPVETAAPVEKSVTVEAPKKIETELVALVNPTAADLQRGAKVYKANCVRCHNADPNLKGSIGPQQVDAPFEVVVAKVMTGKYPDPLPQGFVPKRKTKAMTPLKNVKNDIPYIHAWIQSVKKK